LSGYFACKVTIDSPLDMGEACLLSPNIEDENDIMVDYFVGMACCYFNYYLCYLYMVSIGC
jgi:hypothetical protein